ncbi:hypothetical protein DAQ1742_00456 [Dickeya aquatica]|uniref:Uncharacterized protein n=1 Tax=Dickeya aquatica TaxID=1401087 RepID=A0A375A6F4_9GAMM|nr:hypothetical protein DAQ1742_00456 [Dickeya aquatica]
MFPAPAGINRAHEPDEGGKTRVPRASGDKPMIGQGEWWRGMCSPRQRG